MNSKPDNLYPGAYLDRCCETCGWRLAVYFKSATHYPGEPLEHNPRMWWQTVCLCGDRDYQSMPEPVQMALIEVTP